jgi:isopenicillin N synthase-like dioxygenase
MARWTNDTWLATPHWVAGGGPGEARSTVVTHFLPSVETVIEPLESCMRDTESQYAPVRMYDWNDLYFAKKSRVLRLANAVR